MGVTRILPSYSLWFVKGNKKDGARVLGSPSSIYSPMERQGAEGKGSNVSMNPGVPCLDYPPLGR